jgi:hypothetical protein
MLALAAIALLGSAAQAETKRAQMSVTVVVTTTCSISSTQVVPGEAYSVACSTDTTGGVSRGSESTPHTTTTTTTTTTNTKATSETRVVTILF